MILKRRPDIDRFIAAPGKGILAAVIHGRDLGVVRERAQALAVVSTARPDDPFDVALISEADLDADPGRLEGELMAISMMAGRRLVRLRLSGDKSAHDRLAAEALSLHLDGKLNPDAFLIIEAGPLGKDSALKRIGEKASGCAVIPCYEDEIADLSRFTREALTRDSLSLTSEALELFVRRLPHERGVARREIERLTLFLDPGSGRNGTAADLAGFFGVEPEASLMDAANDAFGARLAAAQAGLRRAAQEGEAGPAAVRALGLHLGRLRRVATLQKSGTPVETAVKSAGVFWKNEREFLRQLRAWTLPALDTVQADILNADRACKQAGSPDRLLAERLALTIAGRARRLGL